MNILLSLPLTITPIILGSLDDPINAGDPTKLWTIQCNYMTIVILHTVTRISIADAANSIHDGHFVIAERRTMSMFIIFNSRK